VSVNPKDSTFGLHRKPLTVLRKAPYTPAVEADGSTIKRTYDFSQFTFNSTGELVSFADRLVKMVGEQASEEAACQVTTRSGVGIHPEQQSMPLEEFRTRANDFDEFQIPDYRRQLIGEPFLVVSFDVTTPGGLVAQFTHSNGHHKVEISGSDQQLVEGIWRRIEEDRQRQIAERVEKASAEAAKKEAVEAEKKAAQAETEVAEAAEAAAEARRWRNRLMRACRKGWESVTTAPAAKWAAGVVGGIIVTVAAGLILVEVFNVSPP
jgi:hypothetical protein